MDVLAIEQALSAGRYVFTDHVREQMSKRQLGEPEIRQVLAAPEEILEVRPGRIVAQSVVGRYLLRVFVDVDRQPLELVTAYRTSKIDYYRNRP